MKRIVSIGLILLMSLQCFYNLGVITYFQLNQDYIAEELCVNREKPMTTCYGQCFLAKKLDIANENKSDDTTVPVGKVRGDVPIFLITENLHLFREFTPIVTTSSRYLLNISSAHHPAPFHPPALLS